MSNDFLSFDLVNEPPAVAQYGMTRASHAALIRRITAAILSGYELERPSLESGNVTELLPTVARYGGNGHGHLGARYETIQGYRVDRALLELLINHRHEE